MTNETTKEEILNRIKSLPHYLDNNDKAIVLNTNTAKDIFAYMQAKFMRGNGEGRPDWVEGHMYALIPKEYQLYIGDIKELCGWKILVVNIDNYRESGNIFYVLFQKDIYVQGAVKVKIELGGM